MNRKYRIRNAIVDCYEGEDLSIEDNLTIETITEKLYGDNIISFSVVGRENSSGSDFWLQAEKYIGDNKTVIFDYDVSRHIETLEELVETVLFLQEQADKIN